MGMQGASRSTSALRLKCVALALMGVAVLSPFNARGDAPAAAVAPSEIEEALARADAIEDADPRLTLEILGPYAESDAPEVAFGLAMAYMRIAVEDRKEGEVARADIQPAIDFAQRTVDLGSPLGWNLLWMIHANGWGFPADDDVALGHLRRGVDAGEAGAMLNYAMLLNDGVGGVERDMPAACALLVQLVDDEGAGAVASHPLGMATIRGDCGGIPDVAGGLAMVERAARGGVREAAYDMGRAHEYGLAGAVDPDQALEWYAEAAGSGEPRAQWRIGIAWVRGEGRARDAAKAVEWFERSAASGFPDGMVSLAVMHATGDGVPLDSVKAAGLYRQAADLGSAHAMRSLAGMQLLGEGMPADPVRALELYEQAVGMGAEEIPLLRTRIEDAIREGAVPVQQ